jgi:hypothetical protein
MRADQKQRAVMHCCLCGDGFILPLEIEVDSFEAALAMTCLLRIICGTFNKMKSRFDIAIMNYFLLYL